MYYYTYDEESRYISHLKEELRKDGYIRDDKVIKTFALKKDFQDSKFYQETKIWYNKQIDNPNRRIDDWTNVIMFKLIDKPYVDGIRDSILDKYKEAEGITDTHAYNLSFNETVVKQCKGIK